MLDIFYFPLLTYSIFVHPSLCHKRLTCVKYVNQVSLILGQYGHVSREIKTKRKMKSQYCSLTPFCCVRLNWFYPTTEVSLFLFTPPPFLSDPSGFIPASIWPWSGNNSVISSLGFLTFFMLPLYSGHIFVNSSFMKPALNYPSLRVHSS